MNVPPGGPNVRLDTVHATNVAPGGPNVGSGGWLAR